MSKQIIVNAQVTGTPTDVARQLRALADKVEAGDTAVVWNCGTRAIIREGEEYTYGEQPFTGRYYAVCHEQTAGAEHAAAFFASEDDARKWSHHGEIITRADVVGSAWFAVTPDPYKNPADGDG